MTVTPREISLLHTQGDKPVTHPGIYTRLTPRDIHPGIYTRLTPRDILACYTPRDILACYTPRDIHPGIYPG